jgi:hypothetical protein
VSAELPIGVTGHPLLPAEGLLLGLDERDAATDIVALAVAAGWLAGAGHNSSPVPRMGPAHARRCRSAAALESDHCERLSVVFL